MFFYKNGNFIASENRGSVNQQIEEIIEEFDFEKVYKVMITLDWIWFGGRITIERLKETAEHLLQDAYNRSTGDESYCSTGGFRAVYVRDFGFRLSFEVDSWETFATL